MKKNKLFKYILSLSTAIVAGGIITSSFVTSNYLTSNHKKPLFNSFVPNADGVMTVEYDGGTFESQISLDDISNLSGPDAEIQFTDTIALKASEVTGITFGGDWSATTSIPNGFLKGFSGLTKLEGLTPSVFPALMGVGDDFMITGNKITSLTFSDFTKFAIIGKNFCKGNDSIKTVNMSNIDSLSVIGDNFLNGSSVETLTITSTDNLIALGNYFCYSCANLTSIDFGAANMPKLLTLGNYFCADCKKLTTISSTGDIGLFSAVNTIGDYFLLDCIALTDISFSDFSSVKKIGRDFFTNCCSIPEVDFDFAALTALPENFLQDCRSLTSFTLSADKITTIPTGFLWNCAGLTEINISKASALTSIGNNFGYNLTKLQTISFPNTGFNIKTIGSKFLYNSTSLSQINNFSDLSSLTLIGDSFLEQSGISTVDIFSAANLTSIGSKFLYNSTAADSGIIVLPKRATPPSLGETFVVNTDQVYINSEAYKTASIWSLVAKHMQMNMVLTDTATTGRVGNEIDPIATVNNPLYQSGEIKWTISNTTYAEIVTGYESTQSGQPTKISFKQATPTGTTITVTASTTYFTQSFVINSISPAGVTELNVEKSTIDCQVMDTCTNKATVNASAGSDVQIIWQAMGSSANYINVLTRSTKPGGEASFQVIDRPANGMATIEVKAGTVTRQFMLRIQYREVTGVEINGESKLTGRQGDADSSTYTATVNPVGANPSVTWSFSDDTNIPSWLTIDSKTGVLSWTNKCEKGTYSFDVKVTSAIKDTVVATKPCVLEIYDAKPTPPTPAHVDENSTWLYWLILAGGIALIFFVGVGLLSSYLYKKRIRK